MSKNANSSDTPEEGLIAESGVDPAETQGKKEQEVTYSVSGGLVGFLASNKISIAISSYQSGKFYLLGCNPKGGIMIHERFFQKAMGISVENGAILLATLFQIIKFENVLDEEQFINETHDACYVPRQSYVTGSLDAHDVGLMQDGRIIFVNTRYNCLSVFSERHSFKPVWKPKFISKIVDEDRCHLNGLAMEEGRPRYVTAVSRSDTVDGWRDRRSNGGIVIDIENDEIVCSGLSMPHSPRIYRSKLWVLNSGTGELGWVDTDEKDKAKAFKSLCFCPGFVRGLAFHGNYAFVGLSRPRYERFEGLALDEKLSEADSEPWCGTQVIDLETGNCVHWFRIDGAVAELYDVGVVPGVSCPMALGFANNDIMSFITHDELDEDALHAPAAAIEA